MSRFRFVEAHRSTYKVNQLCRLVEVSRTGFHAWCTRPASRREIADGELVVVIKDIHERSHGTYGVPRVTGQLHRRGHRVNHKHVARLMYDNAIVGVSNRRKWRKGGGVNVVPAPGGC